MNTLEQIRGYFIRKAVRTKDSALLMIHVETQNTLRIAINAAKEATAKIADLQRYIDENKGKNDKLMAELDRIAPFRWEYVRDNDDIRYTKSGEKYYRVNFSQLNKVAQKLAAVHRGPPGMTGPMGAPGRPYSAEGIWDLCKKSWKGFWGSP